MTKSPIFYNRIIGGTFCVIDRPFPGIDLHAAGREREREGLGKTAEGIRMWDNGKLKEICEDGKTHVAIHKFIVGQS